MLFRRATSTVSQDFGDDPSKPVVAVVALRVDTLAAVAVDNLVGIGCTPSLFAVAVAWLSGGPVAVGFDVAELAEYQLIVRLSLAQ